MIFTWLSPSYDGLDARKRLAARIKTRDRSEVEAQVAEATLEFKTDLGRVRIPLSRIHRLENVANVQTLKDVPRCNRFLISCIDGNRFNGTPQSPARIQVHVPGVTRGWSGVKIVEINFLEVLNGAGEKKVRDE